MPQYILKLPNDMFMLWSTIVDAPTTYAVPREDFVAWYLEQYGTTSADELKKRMARAETHGSSVGHSLEDVIAGNRAGPGESTLTLEEILEQYGPDRAETDEKGPTGP